MTFTVTNKGEQVELGAESLLGAFIGKAKGFFTDAEAKPDVVVGVPPFMSSVER